MSTSVVLKIPVAKLGVYRHPKYGVLEFNQGTFDSLIANHEKRTIGYEPPLRYGHHEKGMGVHDGERALGFGERLYQDGDVLWGEFKPTNQEVVNELQNGEYRYASSEIIWTAKDKKTGQPVGPILRSHALTNTPFLPDLPRNVVEEAASLGQVLSDYTETTPFFNDLLELPTEVREVTPAPSEELTSSMTAPADPNWFEKLTSVMEGFTARIETALSPKTPAPATVLSDEPEAELPAPPAEVEEPTVEEPAPEAPETPETTEENAVTPEEIQKLADEKAAAEKAAADAKAEAEAKDVELKASMAELEKLRAEKAEGERLAAEAAEAARVAEAEAARAAEEAAFATALSDRFESVKAAGVSPARAEKAKGLVELMRANQAGATQLSDGENQVDLVDAVFSLLADVKDVDFAQHGMTGEQPGTMLSDEVAAAPIGQVSPGNPFAERIASMRAARTAQ